MRPERDKKLVSCFRQVEIRLGLLEGLSPRIAVYPGSFNPFHRGHLSIVRQAERVFDQVIIGVAVNRQKAGASETLETRKTELPARLCFHEVATIPGLLTDFVEEFPLPLSVVRGVRDGTDLAAELRSARFLGELRPESNVVWIGCKAELQHLSSNAIRELESISPGSGSRDGPDTAAIYGLEGKKELPLRLTTSTMKSLVLLAVLAGSLIPLQSCLNARLRGPLGGPFPAALVSFSAGLIALFAACIVTRVPWPTAEAARQIPWWGWIGGGLCGAVFVSANVLLTPRLGVTTSLVAALAGQLAASILMDHFGVLGLASRPATPARIGGLALILAGVWLVRRF